MDLPFFIIARAARGRVFDMKAYFRNVTLVACLLALAGTAAAETKEDRLSSDKTQEQYTRKSMTFLGTVIEDRLQVPSDVLAGIEKVLRSEIELKRFDYNSVDVSKFKNMDDFIAALRQYVLKRSQDRAAAEAEMDARFKQARVLASDIDRIMMSAYFFQFELFAYRSKAMICPFDAVTAARLECTPGVAGIKAVVNAKAVFYRADLSGKGGKGYKLIRSIKEMPGKGFTPFASQPPPQPRKPQAPILKEGATDEEKEAARERHDQAKKAYQQALAAMAEYQRRLPEFDRQTRVRAAINAISGVVGLAKRLGNSMKKIPDFQIKTPVTAALPDGVEFMLGKGEGLGLDDTYDVTEFDAAGKKSLIGYVKVRKISDPKGSGEGSPSYAEKVKEKRDFVGGESLIEHPMLNANVGIHGIFEFNFVPFPFEDDGNILYGAGFYFDYDLGPTVNWSEFYLSLEADYLYMGHVDSLDADLALVHGMLGFKKKWYIESLIIAVGLRGGVSYFMLSDDTLTSDDSVPMGFGGDAMLGFEYYIVPAFSIYLNAHGRFFTNSLATTGTTTANNEMAVQAALGVRLGF